MGAVMKNYIKRQDAIEYLQYLKKRSDDFVPITDSDFTNPNDIKLLAFYLPQFHSIELNDKYHGKGFTEWDSVVKTRPAFIGHYQPHLPIDVGFYDLSHEDIMFRQIELAKKYGIYGFCAYYYWFSGKKLLDKPFENYLKNKKLDFPYCFCWDCGSWRNFWNRGQGEMIIEQKTTVQDAPRLCNDLLPHFNDPRYIKISGKPVFAMFAPKSLGNIQEIKLFTNALRDNMRKHGLEIFLILIRTNDMYVDGTWNLNPEKFGFDAFSDFPPHNLENITPRALECPKKTVAGYHAYNVAQVWDIKSYIEKQIYAKVKEKYKVFKSIFPSWDNVPRHFENGGGHIFYGETPDLYKQWLTWSIEWTYQNHSEQERIIFINAWNEWAEGAHLEPDHKFGYAYLQKTREALEEFYDKL